MLEINTIKKRAPIWARLSKPIPIQWYNLQKKIVLNYDH